MRVWGRACVLGFVMVDHPLEPEAMTYAEPAETAVVDEKDVSDSQTTLHLGEHNGHEEVPAAQPEPNEQAEPEDAKELALDTLHSGGHGQAVDIIDNEPGESWSAEKAAEQIEIVALREATAIIAGSGGDLDHAISLLYQFEAERLNQCLEVLQGLPKEGSYMFAATRDMPEAEGATGQKECLQLTEAQRKEEAKLS